MDSCDKDVKLSAEVEPFIPQKKGLEGALVTMSLSGGGEGGGGVEPTPIPNYLITCYPFVQENQPNRQQHHMYSGGGDLRWQQPNPSPGGPYLAYPILSSPQPPVSNDYTYYQIMPAPCPPMMGFYQPFPGTYAGPLQPGVVNPVSADVSERPDPLGQVFGLANQRGGRGMVRPAVLPKQQQVGLCQPLRARRPPMRTVAVQKEVCSSGPDGRTKTVLLVDAAQQTDFPGDSACGRGAEREQASPLLWKNLPRRRRASHPAESSSEADIDSDSGYCSPKHNQQAPGATQHTAHAAVAPTGVDAGVMTAVSWVNVASQASPRPWLDNRTTPFQRTGKTPDQRNYSQQDFHAGYSGGRVCSNPTPADSNCGLRQRRLQPGLGPGTVLAPEPLYFEDEDEFPELVSGGAQRNIKPDPNPSQNQHQSKLTKNLLDNLPENSPINIVQTPIPITTSVPKRAKSQRKKALAAALATAQEYSEISMEQRKLQEALTKAAGKKSKTPVQLDLGDMLAALEKQQQAMKARQITNTKPLSFTVGTAAPFHGSGAGPGAGSGIVSMLKAQQAHSAPLNMLDSSAPRLKRGKEREIPKVKRPTALKKIILKEREGKRGKGCVDQIATSQEEQGEEELHFTDDLTREPASQEGRYQVRGQREEELHFTDDLTREPASQEGRVRGQREEELHFTDDLTREPASQEGRYQVRGQREEELHFTDDLTREPASQESRYRVRGQREEELHFTDDLTREPAFQEGRYRVRGQREEELHFTDDLTREPAFQEGRYRVRGQREEELHFTDDLTREPASQEGRYRVRGQREEELHFTDDLTREPASQEENGLSVPSDDASLSPASQNSPYSITPVSQGSPGSSGIGSPMASNAITKIHSRRFREYCNQVLNKEIDESVTMLLQELVRFQERVYQKDPSKAKTKRRLVMGLREVTKHMKLHKIKCVLISPNCEKIQAKGGLDEALYNVIAMAREQEIPFVFALGRKALGRCVNKLVPVSVVGVFNFSGAEGLFNRLVSLTEDARKSYKDMVSALEQEQAEEALKNVKKVTHHMGHSRNPSAASAISFCSVISEPISEVNEKEYETNWRSMVESSDGLEPVEAKPSHPAASSGLQRDNQPPSTTTNRSPYSTTLQLRAAVPAPGSGPGEREEGRADDRLELASQQSTETGSLDGSCRDLLNSSITSTTSTLVPGMLEEAEEEEEEEEEYTPEPISVEVPAVISRIECWVSKTLENLQLGKSQDSTEEEEEEEEEEEGVQSEEEEELDSADVTETGLERTEKMEANNITG
ncbi:selenocysteine insertion sequence-binding protein 2-like isoform X3 [Salvelinus namaycush]|uniref:Selenocysteine insertion sequence-binding protein 2-like isoform X3 n=1 Tax=Salvelinus namaycush TaxID=8040 RepID=A0A8U0PJD0_SALNM|nr:selenocysteine insertion sequence-binding protein 2-like isoform X3 [Salvelinus namaycush]